MSETTAAKPEVSIILEGYNHAEGSSQDRLMLAARAAVRTAQRQGSAEVLLADPSGDPDLTAALEAELPEVRFIDARGLHYEEAKTAAIEEAQGEYMLFLDGDVIPERDDWAAIHVSALRQGAEVTVGFTRYDRGLFQDVYSLMDFGFLLPSDGREARCYASNNAGFRAETLSEFPIPQGPLRSNCYQHSELLRRRGVPLTMVPEARVEHEKQSYWEERFRRGYDQVGACWGNRELPEAKLLKLGPLAAPLFYARDVLIDWRRLFRGGRHLGFGPAKTAFAALVIPVLRLGDLAGMLRALVTPPRARVAPAATQTDPSR